MYRTNNRLMAKGFARARNVIAVAALTTMFWQSSSGCLGASLVEVGRKGASDQLAEPASPLNDYDIALFIDKSRSMTRMLRGGESPYKADDFASIKANEVTRVKTEQPSGLPPEPIIESQNVADSTQIASRDDACAADSDQVERVREHAAIIAAEEATMSPKQKRLASLERHRLKAKLIHEQREARIRKVWEQRQVVKQANSNTFSEYGSFEDSRWAWCQKQAQALSAKLADMQPEGIRTILFSDDFIENEKSDASRIHELFHNTQPLGATKAAEPLRREFEKFFAHRAANRIPTKPLLIAIITDGYMNDKRAVRTEIINACSQLESGNEILVAFLTVGTDGYVPLFLRELDNMSPMRAKFDIVEVRTFDELDEKGLAGVLEELVTSRQQKPITTAQAP